MLAFKLSMIRMLRQEFYFYFCKLTIKDEVKDIQEGKYMKRQRQRERETGMVEQRVN